MSLRDRTPSHTAIGPARLLAVLVVAALVVSASAQEPPTPDVTTVTVTAEGYDRADALKRALRTALEQGAGVQIAAYSTTSNYELTRDTIYSRAAGIVRDYRVLGENEGPGGTRVVTIEATVRPDAVARTWGEVQNLLDQIGRPKIMVWIDERIDGRLQVDSVVADRIEKMFSGVGFDLVARLSIVKARHRTTRSSPDRADFETVRQLALDAGAHIIIHGTANADRAGLRSVYGVQAAFYNCDVQASVYYTDTGKLIAGESAPQTRAGVRSRSEFSPQAARAALVKATFPDVHNPALPTPLAARIYEAIMEQWSTQITAGGEVELVVSGLNVLSYTRLKDSLAEIKHVRAVGGEFAQGVGTYRIHTDMSADTLAKRLANAPLDRQLEVTEMKLNRIKARAMP